MPQLDVSRIRAITLDLDDTLWPIWPTINRAEAALHAWLKVHAPVTGDLSLVPGLTRAIRHQLVAERPDYANDLAVLRRECIRSMLVRAGEDPALAEPAFEIFFEERQRVDFFEDALPALEFLSSRFPVVALSNGNADVQRVGIGRHFCAAFSAAALGVGKPDPRMFQVGARAAGVPPEAVLHIGDDPHLDGVGALNAGLQMAWVNRAGHAWEHPAHQPHVTVAELLSLCELFG
jgi:HAD superfamily hydrolase (TIGR01549 family)